MLAVRSWLPACVWAWWHSPSVTTRCILPNTRRLSIRNPTIRSHRTPSTRQLAPVTAEVQHVRVAGVAVNVVLVRQDGKLLERDEVVRAEVVSVVHASLDARDGLYVVESLKVSVALDRGVVGRVGREADGLAEEGELPVAG